MPRDVKVSGFVPISDHTEMNRIARENQSTIGAIVTLAVRHFVSQLNKHPKLSKKLARDPRSIRSTKETA